MYISPGHVITCTSTQFTGIARTSTSTSLITMKLFSLTFSYAIILTAFHGLASCASFSNPLKPRDGSDPHIVHADGHYYLMTTTWSNLQITRAKTLEGLKSGETKVVWTDSNPSRCCNVWAPELHFINSTYVFHDPPPPVWSIHPLT